MRIRFRSAFAFFLLFSLIWIGPAGAQERRGSIAGRVIDASQGVLPGARIELQPGGNVAISDARGDFSITNLAPGRYTLTASYVGFEPFSTSVNITADSIQRVEATLQIGNQSEMVTVRGDRQHGEVEAINIERTADNIIQVLPNEVITSLPNTNIADAVGRLPSVSLERDEGEGKYIQIRGTEPRLSNVTVNGIHLPSPEGVRNVKLDVIPADLVDMVEVNKTLSANQDADAIGGSVNLVTKTPADQPYVTFLGMGGYTPISGGRDLYQLAGTAGQRFGPDKKFGALFGFSYDYNARGIDDVEPVPNINAFTPDNGSVFVGPFTEDLRNYHYDRSRYGLDGELDYKIGDMSSVYLRGFFSHFRDFGEDWIYTPSINVFPAAASLSDSTVNTCGLTSSTQFGNPTGCGNMGFTDISRTPTQQIFSVQAGARHAVRSVLLTYELALSQAKYAGGFPRVGFDGPGTSDNSIAFGVDTKDPFVPKLPVLNGLNIYDPTQYSVSYGNTENDSIFERDVVGDISLSKQYSLGSHFTTFEVGFKGWDARKSSIYDRENFNAAGGQPMTEFLSNFKDNNYYFGNYSYGPVTQFSKILSALQPGGTSPALAYNLQNDFDISERIWAGYAMNTISLGRLRLQTGVRIESTSDSLRGNNVTLDTNGDFSSVSPLTADHSYVDVFPSVQAQYRLGSDTILRAAYGIGIARPNFGDIAPYFTDDPTSTPEFARGNPDLKPTHAQNFDLLAEHYLKPLGLIQAGFFYKALTDPIYTTTVFYPPSQTSTTEAVLVNGPSAHIAGFEAAWQQRLSFLPGALNGMGVRANYSYTSSQATFPAGNGRTDHPTLLRTAPNNWNIDATYDRKGFSARMGLTHNDGYIWSYGGSNAKDPSGETYLYPHTQVDAQVSYWIPRGHGLQAVVSMLNLNNEVFGFYNGAERYPIQREYYGRTVSVGVRWTPFAKETQ
ncbi:MAG TPA: TonB-dependent receptor [Candidatus Sulfotelmatobacter sp.]